MLNNGTLQRTISVDASCVDEWLEYMVTDHIPAVLSTGHFRDYKLCRVEGDEQGGLTYAVQYLAHSADAFNKYQEECAPELQQDFIERWEVKLQLLERFFLLFQKV